MRLHGRWALPLACALALLAAGCGASAPVHPHSVSVSITAPTSGATLGVHRVLVTGVVTPADAQVSVEGQPAQVSAGRFSHSVWLTTPSQNVTVTAQAPGYASTTTATTVKYSSVLAEQITTSSTQLAPGPASVALATPISSGAAASALSAALSLPASVSSSPGSRHSHATTHASTSGSGSGSTPTTTTPSAPTTTTSPSPATTPPVVTGAQIKHTWTTSCLKHAAGVNVTPYCSCVYNHLYVTGVFNTVSSVNALVKKLNADSRSGDYSSLTKVEQEALSVCSAKLPALTPLGGKPTLTKLPGASHDPVTSPSTTTSTTPTASSATATTPTTTTTTSTLSPVPPAALFGAGR